MNAHDLDDLPAGGLSDEFRRGMAFAEACQRQAEADHAEATALALAGRRAAVVSWPRLVAALEQHHLAAGATHDAALADARREAAWLVLTARATTPGAAMDALDRLDGAVEALAAERDEMRARIERAVAELDAAPELDPKKPSARVLREVLLANGRAGAVLREGRDPPGGQSKGIPVETPLNKSPIFEALRPEDAPRDLDAAPKGVPDAPSPRASQVVGAGKPGDAL